MATAWKKYRLILLERSDFYKFDNLSVAIHVFDRGMFILLLVDEIFLLSYVNRSTNFKNSPFLKDDDLILFKMY